jgi:hypothetical protein
MKTIMSLLIAMLFIGCANNIAYRQSKDYEYQSTIPICNEETCKAKWSAAQSWVSSYCFAKINIVTDTVIETYAPPPNSEYIAAKVIKEAVGNGTYLIKITVYCDNPIVCEPDTLDSSIAFNKYVNQF